MAYTRALPGSPWAAVSVLIMGLFWSTFNDICIPADCVGKGNIHHLSREVPRPTILPGLRVWGEPHISANGLTHLILQPLSFTAVSLVWRSAAPAATCRGCASNFFLIFLLRIFPCLRFLRTRNLEGPTQWALERLWRLPASDLVRSWIPTSDFVQF